MAMKFPLAHDETSMGCEVPHGLVGEGSDIVRKRATAERLLDMLDEEWVLKLAGALLRNGLIECPHEVHAEIGERAFPVKGDWNQGGRTPQLGETALGEISQHFDPRNGVERFSAQESTRSLQLFTPHMSDFSEGSISAKGRIRAASPTGTLEDGKHSESAQTQVELVQDAKEFTTLVVHNLPRGTEQRKAMAWVDCAGFNDTYDFLLWFPPKLSAQSTCGYLFINFLTTAHAKYFRTLFSGYTFPNDEAQCAKHGLRIRAANVQGFAANHARYGHFLDPGVQTNCVPFFAKSSVEKLAVVEQSLAARNSTVATDATTIIIRNLPRHVDSQDLGMVWLDEAGYRDAYDFCFLAPKLKTSGVETYIQAHMFVNFETQEAAERCIKTLNGQVHRQGEPALEVVFSRIQGLSSCVSHFQSCFERKSTKCKPWVKTCFAAR